MTDTDIIDALKACALGDSLDTAIQIAQDNNFRKCVFCGKGKYYRGWLCAACFALRSKADYGPNKLALFNFVRKIPAYKWIVVKKAKFNNDYVKRKVKLHLKQLGSATDCQITINEFGANVLSKHNWDKEYIKLSDKIRVKRHLTTLSKGINEAFWAADDITLGTLPKVVVKHFGREICGNQVFFAAASLAGFHAECLVAGVLSPWKPLIDLFSHGYFPAGLTHNEFKVYCKII